MSNENQLVRLNEQTLFGLLQPKQADLVRMIGEDRMKREISFALQAVNMSDQLSKCTNQSIAKAIYNLALTGLTLNPIMKLSYLTPRYNKAISAMEAQLTPSYQGLVKLIADTGSVANVFAYAVYKGDTFKLTLGTSPEVHHERGMGAKDIIGAYAVAVLPDGSKVVESMDIDEIHEIRERSDTYQAYKLGKIKSCTWETDKGEMCRKTVIKRVSKYVPKTERWLHVQAAIDVDNQEYPATWGQQEFVMSLLTTSTYDEMQRDIIRDKVDAGVTSSEAETMIRDLQNNQLDRVKSGLPYNAGDANKALEKAVNNNSSNKN